MAVKKDLFSAEKFLKSTQESVEFVAKMMSDAILDNIYKSKEAKESAEKKRETT